MKTILKKFLPYSVQKLLIGQKHAMAKTCKRMIEALGYDIYPSGYNSSLPTETKLKKNIYRWNKPSSMVGVTYNVENFKRQLGCLVEKYLDEFQKLAGYNKNSLIGFGPGYTELDALLLYMMIREIKPGRYIEVGSGLSTYYCSLAAKENFKTGNPVKISCIEPHPFGKLYTIQDIEVIRDEVQNVNMSLFSELEENDVLFIDSSHILKIDGDLPFLYLEVLPALKKGVMIHIHDIPFPYNIPYPPELWIFSKELSWPYYWNEAMFLQAFMAFNNSFDIVMSMPLIRHHDEQFLKNAIPLYKSVKDNPNTFSSIWLKKIK